ncbi:MAG: hypothetical protein M5U34_05780 [Chloroflexi bacterium]|nr:hypothetical protein [Chloroflexota bacterium]
MENPVELSLAEIKALGKQEQITMHHCIQGWTGIAEWGRPVPGKTGRVGAAQTRGRSCRVLFLRRGIVWRGILRHAVP